MKILLKDVKLTRDCHEHLERQGLITLDDLEAACTRQIKAIPDDAVMRSICTDCQDAVWKARELKEKLIKEERK